MVEMAINNSLITGTKFSPYYLNLGYHPVLLHDLPDEGILAENPKNFVRRMQGTFVEASKCLEKVQVNCKEQADKHRRQAETFAVGSLVLVNLQQREPQMQLGKLRTKWSGPFKILQQITPSTYKLELPGHLRIHNVFHVSVLKHYYNKDDETSSSTTNEPSGYNSSTSADTVDSEDSNHVPHLSGRTSLCISDRTRGSSSDSMHSWHKTDKDVTDVMLDPTVFRNACTQLQYTPEVDLMGNSEHHQLPRYFSKFTDVNAIGTNSFQYNWSKLKRPYVNPPFYLISKVLRKFQVDGVNELMIVVPYWFNSEWWKVFTKLCPNYITYTHSVYCDDTGKLRPKAPWDTVIGVLRKQ